jgi:hypothetical protein
MRERWDYRAVEGALYSLGRPVQVSPVSAAPLSSPRPSSAPGPRGPSREVVARADFDLQVRRSLTPDEVTEVREHYILGVKRHGYQRRAQIIKKLMTTLNEEEPYLP